MAIFPYFADFTEFTPTIPKMYWDVYSQEERIKTICEELGKLIAYVDAMADTVNSQYAAIEALELTVSDKAKEAAIEVLNDEIASGAFDNLVQTTVEKWASDHSAELTTIQSEIDLINAELAKIKSASTYSALKTNGFAYKEA